MAMTERSPGGQGGRTWEMAAPTYRQGWESRYKSSGRRWDDAEPGYRFSYEMARDPRYQGRDWSEVEATLRTDYAAWARRQGYREDAWERLRGDVREAWEAERATVGTATGAMTSATTEAATVVDEDRIIELREEQLVPHKEMREVGEVQIRTEVEQVPSRLEVDAYREEVEVEHVPVGEIVSERVSPWEEGDVLIVPIYEEQLVMVKRLMLREHMRVRRVRTMETRLFEDTVRREHVVIEDPTNSGLVHERFADQPVDSTRGRVLDESRDNVRGQG